MNHFVLIHQNGDKSSVELLDDKKSARAAFKKIDTGLVTLYELRRSQATKRSNFDLEHKDSKKSLSKLSDVQLRAEARKRKLQIADNPQATSGQIISEIQQDELTQRLNHRRPIASSVEASVPAAKEDADSEPGSEKPAKKKWFGKSEE